MEAIESASRLALDELQSGRDTVLYTALGAPSSGSAHNHELGIALGRLLLKAVQQSGVRRVVLCGGDTSSQAIQQLDLIALTFAGTLAPGAPLCRAHATSGLDGLEVVLKGGQMGPEDFFGMVRHGTDG
jgi:3-oxoisoapionate kinase